MSDHTDNYNAASDDSIEGNTNDIYKLTSERMSRHRSSLERRRFKDLLGDRRSKVRLTASGEPQSDRRTANRVANERLRKKTG